MMAVGFYSLWLRLPGRFAVLDCRHLAPLLFFSGAWRSMPCSCLWIFEQEFAEALVSLSLPRAFSLGSVSRAPQLFLSRRAWRRRTPDCVAVYYRRSEDLYCVFSYKCLGHLCRLHWHFRKRGKAASRNTSSLWSRGASASFFASFRTGVWLPLFGRRLARRTNLVALTLPLLSSHLSWQIASCLPNCSFRPRCCFHWFPLLWVAG